MALKDLSIEAYLGARLATGFQIEIGLLLAKSVNLVPPLAMLYEQSPDKNDMRYVVWGC